MSTTRQDTGVNGQGIAGVREDHVARFGFDQQLESWLGKMVTIVNPESFEDAPVGRQMRVGFYRARFVGLGTDYITLSLQYVRTGPRAGVEPVRQYVPLSMIKRISALKPERVIHL